MAKREALDRAYMKCAFAIAELSQARRKKVGAIIVVPNGGIIAEGFNGTPNGFDNNCEEERYWTVVGDSAHEVEISRERALELGDKAFVKLVTKQECVHAEANAIAKVACSTNSSRGGTMYCTLTPCLECAKLIRQARIVRVVYAEQYPYAGHTGESRALGLELLRKAGIEVYKLDGFTEH